MAASNEKNKIIVVSVLLLVILGVGAFQLTKAPEPVVKDIKLQEQTAIADAVASGIGVGDPVVGENLVAALPQHDPFTPKIIDPALVQAREAQAKQAAERKEQEDREKAEQKRLEAEARNMSNPRSNLQPMQPLPGTIQNISGTNSQNPGASQPEPPSFKLTGIILGDNPMAVLKDVDGRQRLLGVGDTVQDMRVIAISKGKVTLEGQGQKRVLILK